MNNQLSNAIKSKEKIIVAVNTILGNGFAPIELRDQLGITLDEYQKLINPSDFNINLYTLEKLIALSDAPITIGDQPWN